MPRPPQDQSLRFTISHRSLSTRGRVGVVETPHGSFDTPAFMPVGTRGSVKGLLPELVRATGAQIILNNTYHLLLRPGPDLVEQMGGAHRFMNWPGPILTDSGGFQAFSMADINALDEDGVSFKSIVDGSKVRMTPESAIDAQNKIGADIIMAFDDCPPARDPGEAPPNLIRQKGTAGVAKLDEGVYTRRVREANERTVRWLDRCIGAHARPQEQALFGIVQGGTDPDERAWSAERICSYDLPGFAIGGVAVGESSEEIARVVAYTAPLMPEDKPRYLMGVGYERDIVSAVRSGVDMFDCVLPTRNGRNANAFSRTGQIRLRNAAHRADPSPIEAGCSCPACDPGSHGWATPDGASFSRAYIRHLFACGEMLGPILVSLHNLHHFQRLMVDIRRALREDDWRGFAQRWPVAAPALTSGTADASEGSPAGRGPADDLKG